MDPRENRYQEWGYSSGYYTRPSSRQNTFMTDNMCRGKFDPNATSSSYLFGITQREKNKSQVVRKDTVGNSDIFSKTEFMDDFINQRSWVNIIRHSKDEEIWRDAFFSIMTEPDQNSVHVSKIDNIVFQVFGDEAPGFILDKFRKASLTLAKEQVVCWDDFRMIIQKVLTAAEADCVLIKDVPPLIKLMTRPRLVDKNMGPLGDVSTVYRDTILHSANLSETSRGHFSPNATRTAKNTLTEWTHEVDPTSQILFSGTTKINYQIPGYSGTIPMNLRNVRKAEHSSGLHPKPVENNLILTQKNMGCTLNYTGYVSKYAGTFAERTTACDPRTSNGAAYGPVRCML